MSSLRVVLVDDCDDTRYALRVALERDGRFSVVGEASSADEAIGVVGSADADVIVLDNSMPGQTGLSALGAIRAAAPQSRVALYTGMPLEELRLDELDDLPDEFISKDAAIEELIAALVRVDPRRTPEP